MGNMVSQCAAGFFVLLWGGSSVLGAASQPARTAEESPALPRIYWASSIGPTVTRSLLDGTGGETVLFAGGAYGLAIDPQQGKVYWTDQSTLEIHCANLDGTDNRTVVPRGVTSNPIDIDFSAEERKIYWTDEFAAI